ncbi:MAG TPA: pitrilysin family protein, partial [Acidimicrobiales bacterium]|nr:pitrilysin family protein [Acidimicrobiales bacterium]
PSRQWRRPPSPQASVTARSSAIHTEQLASGVRLATETMPDVRSVAIGFWVGTGSRDEPAHLAGASHFLEHLLFKGTPARSAAAIAEALDEVGGDCNAFTAKEYTAFYVRLLSEHLHLGLDILADIMEDPSLDDHDVDAERSVILDEILMHADEPADLVGETAMAALYPGHPLGRDTLGTAESVRATTASDVRRFFEEHYRPGNMVVSVAGDCRHEEVVAALDGRFAARPGGMAPARDPVGLDVEPLVVVRRPTEQAHLVLAMRSVSRFDDTRWPLGVLNVVLGGGLSSRLFQKVREQRGLAYSIWSERHGFFDTGCATVSVGTAPEHVDEVLRIVTGEIESLAEEGISPRELDVAKGNLRSETLLSCEDSGARMSRLGTSVLLYDRAWTIDEVLEHIDAVDVDAVREVARSLAVAPRTLAAVGPFDADMFDGAALGLAGRAA